MRSRPVRHGGALRQHCTIAANSVVGEREQGTLEPVLTTPIRREELLIGKAVANLIPAVGRPTSSSASSWRLSASARIR
ncbi:ABC transporter permease subunit [Kitasatospora sp. MAA4]|uniref:ABC transporter permease n=1 Tax=Kitasatospora sp. MAA4 TaxID=3035093 RepID=UPI002475248B|nr:ABC transporter permease subunit [Kitasatospora sp. MAA4]